jgi:hypothetical protein
MAWSDDDLEDHEFPDEDDDFDDEEATLTRECPRCGVDIYEDVEQCPLCGTWLTSQATAWSGRSWWWIALGLLGIIAMVLALSLGGF